MPMKFALKVVRSHVDKDGFIEWACEVTSPDVALEINDFVVLKSRRSNYKKETRQIALTTIGVTILTVHSNDKHQENVATLALNPTMISTAGPPCRNWFGVIYLALQQSTYSAVIDKVNNNSISTIIIWLDTSRVKRRRTTGALTVYSLRSPWCNDISRGVDVPIKRFRFVH
jgi:hypothetical protein